MLVLLLFATVLVMTSSMDLQEIEEELERNLDWDFLKNFFQFHLYVNPHPICALEDEPCTLDNNCCRGMECKVTVDRDGVKYTCQTKVGENTTNDVAEEEATNEDDVHWSFATEGVGRSDEYQNNFLKEIYRARLGKLKEEEEKLIDDQYYLIKELQKPLTIEEMREMQQLKELEDYKRERELKELREWAKKKEIEKTMEKERMKILEKTAKDRVAKVLKEEERQKLEMFKKIQKKMKQDLQNKS